MAEHKCVRCQLSPPKTVRKIAPKSPVRKPLCFTHLTEKNAEDKKNRHEKRVTKTYNLAPGEYDRLKAAQGGTCWFPQCTATGKKRALTVDHDHETGEVRGLVCLSHNYYLLGWFKNDLLDAIKYIVDPPYRRLKEGRPLHD